MVNVFDIIVEDGMIHHILINLVCAKKLLSKNKTLLKL